VNKVLIKNRFTKLWELNIIRSKIDQFLNCCQTIAMRRFFINPSEINKSEPLIVDQDATHIKTVLRLKKKDRIILLDGSGYEYHAEITGINSETIGVRILDKNKVMTESSIELIVFQCFLKEKKMDRLLRQLTTIGISEWVPVFSERSVPKLDQQRLNKKIKRWEIIAREAVKQCRRGIIPKISGPLVFRDALRSYLTADLKICFFAGETIPVGKLVISPLPVASKIIIIIGPEGGFTQKEIELVRSADFKTASLGPRILKSETAAITASTIIQYHFGDMG